MLIAAWRFLTWESNTASSRLPENKSDSRMEVRMQWISVKERLPQIDQRVWIRKVFKPKWKPRLATWKVEYDKPLFLTDTRFCYIPDGNGVSSVSHWRSADADIAGTAAQPQRAKKRRYNLTPEGAAAKREKMKEYWRKRKGAAAGG
jgi:hypothetical protein